MIVKLLTEHHSEFLSLKGGCRCSSESTPVKMPHCWKSHALAHLQIVWTRPDICFDKVDFATKKKMQKINKTLKKTLPSRQRVKCELHI